MAITTTHPTLATARTLLDGALHEGTAGDDGLKDLETVGDVVLAGRRSPYPHLSEHLDRARPTIGALAATVRRLAAGPEAWRHRLSAQPPDPVVRIVLARDDDHEVGVVHLGPDRFTGLDGLDGALCLVEGGLHLATTNAGGMLAMHRLRQGRVRVVGSGHGHELLSTGSTPAVALYAHTLHR